jgi:tetratricopeptide (TPR) repeat protein
LKEFDHARKLYQKYIEFDPTNSTAWIKYAELEAALQDIARVRAIYELGISQARLAMPEVLWKSYIDFESVEGAYERDRTKVRALYERLVERTGHVKVWISWALFEGGELKPPAEEDEEGETQEAEGIPGDLEKGREIFERGYKDLRSKGLKDEVRPTLHPTPPDTDCPFASALFFSRHGRLLKSLTVRKRTLPKFKHGCPKSPRDGESWTVATWRNVRFWDARL